MRKSRISHFADTFFWYAIYMFPIIAYLLLLIAELGSGMLPLFKTNMPTIILSWFVSTYIVHLAIDVLLFIPRFAHKFIEKTTQGE